MGNVAMKGGVRSKNDRRLGTRFFEPGGYKIHSRLKSPRNHTGTFMYLWLMLGWGQPNIASHNYMNVPVWLRELFKRECRTPSNKSVNHDIEGIWKQRNI